MFKRLFYATVGLGAGMALGIYAVRKIESARRRLTPEALAGSAAVRAGSVRDRLALAVEQGRRAAAAREAELRAVYRVQPQAGRHLGPVRPAADERDR